MRGWHSMCDVGPALRCGDKSLVPAARTPALALSRRVLQEDAVGSGATFELAAAERRPRTAATGPGPRSLARMHSISKKRSPATH